MSIDPSEQITDDASLDRFMRAVACAPEVDPSGIDLVPGQIVDQCYEIVRAIGAGGMGLVYEAVDRTLDRRVALKLHRRARSELTVSRALREAQTMARVRHPNVVTVHAVGTHKGALYIAMEYVAGGNLRAWLEAKPRSVAEILDVFEAAALGLAAAHDAGLVHRDFKPDNVLMDDGDRPRVADFGIARIADARTVPEAFGSDPSSDEARVSLFGPVVGTLAYAAPEQVAGEDVDARSDQYSYCAALYEVLYGRTPFDIQPLATLLRRVEKFRLGTVNRSPRRRVPAAVRNVVHRGLRFDPALRFADMRALLVALRRARTRNRRIAGTALLLGVAATTAGWLAWPEPAAVAIASCDDAEAQLAGVWDDDRKRAVLPVLDAAEAPTLPAARQVELAVDRYAQRWSTQWGQDCGRPPSRHCLLLARARLDDLMSFLQQSGPDAVVHAVEAVGQLPNPLMCASPDDDPEATEEANADRAELEARLDQAWLRFVVDPEATSTEELEELVATAEEKGYADLAAGALSLVGTREYNTGQRHLAEDTLRRAVTLAVVSGSRSSMAMTWSQLAPLLATDGRLEDAREKIELARGAAREVQDPKVAAMLSHNIGVALQSFGDTEAAIELLREAVAAYIQTVGPRHAAVGRARAALGGALIFANQSKEAKEQLERAIEIFETTFGTEHPTYLDALGKLGLACTELGEWECAESSLEEAVRSLEAVFGPDSARTIEALEQVGHLHVRRGDIEAGLTAARRVRDAASRRGPSIELARAEGNLAIILATDKRWAEAYDHAQASRDVFVEVADAEDPHLVDADVLLGTILRELGRLDESAAALQRAVSLAARVLSPRNRGRVNAMIEFGYTELARGNDAEALRQGEAVLAVMRDSPGPPLVRAEASFIVASALGHDDPRAVALARESRAAFERLGPAFAEQTARVVAWLGD